MLDKSSYREDKEDATGQCPVSWLLSSYEERPEIGSALLVESVSGIIMIGNT